MDNKQLQQEELMVLSSIYEDQWQQCYSIKDTYFIELQKDAQLWITLNDEYPTNQMPSYEIFAPNLSKKAREHLHDEFHRIYEQEQGSIIFQWIEKFKHTINSHKPQFGKVNSTSRSQVDKTPLNITHGAPITDRKSTFQGHVCKITHPSQVGQFLEELLTNKKIAQAKHNVVAYRVAQNKKITQDCSDDGENLAGRRLLHLLKRSEVEDVAVVVTRWYGGVQLGTDRFKHYNNAAKIALEVSGILK